jgi:hypothetical protein
MVAFIVIYELSLVLWRFAPKCEIPHRWKNPDLVDLLFDGQQLLSVCVAYPLLLASCFIVVTSSILQFLHMWRNKDALNTIMTTRVTFHKLRHTQNITVTRTEARGMPSLAYTHSTRRPTIHTDAATNHCFDPWDWVILLNNTLSPHWWSSCPQFTRCVIFYECMNWPGLRQTCCGCFFPPVLPWNLIKMA